MKHSLLSFALAGAIAATIAACGPPIKPDNTPAQNALNTTATTCKDITEAIKATDAAVVAGVLKGDNARAAAKGLEAAQTGCRTALAAYQSAAAQAAAASGAK
jgi:hypothetical protein